MASRYETPGKQAFRELLFSVSAHDALASYGTFWGTGIDARLFASAGIDVIACEIVHAKHDALSCDALTYGYRAHLGRAGKLTERLDMFHADFDGGPSPSNFREVRRIAAITDKWLAVTLSMDHQRDESMMGEAAFYTIPAWLTGASGFTLEYLSRYKRNGYGQVMWVALLRPRTGRGTAHQVLPIQIAYSIRDRGYWASRRFYEFDLLAHRYSPRNEREKVTGASYYQANRSRYQDQSRIRGKERRMDPEKYARDRARSSAWSKSPAGHAWWKEYGRTRRQDPEYRAKKKAYHHAWYLRRKSDVSGTPDEAVKD